MACNNTFNTPDKNNESNKRPIEATLSPSDGEQADHVHAPTPLRRKASLPDLQDPNSSVSSTISVHGKNMLFVVLQ